MADIVLVTLNIRGLKNKQKYIIHLVRKHRPDFIFLQETNINTHFIAQRYTADMGFKNSIFSLGTYARGVSIIQTSDKYTVTHTHTDDEGRLAIIRVENENNKYTLVNIYAPVRHADKPAFFLKLEEILEKNFTDDTLILGGDFNFTHASIDRQGAKINNQNKQWLEHTLHTFNLVDAYRTTYPTGRDTTFKHNSIVAKSRLDRFYVPNEKEITMVCRLEETLGYTDHKAVCIRLSNGETDHARQRGSPHWKFNNSLLASEFYTKTIKTLIENSLDINNTDTQVDIGELWLILKDTIKYLTIGIAKNISTQRRRTEQRLKEQLEHTAEDTAEAHTLRTQLEDIENHKYIGAQTRCRAIGTIESPNKAFLGIEQNMQRRRTITQTIDAKGQTHTDNKAVAEIFRDHF